MERSLSFGEPHETAQQERELGRSHDPQRSFFLGARGGNFAPTHAPSCEENAVALETTAFLVDEGHRSLEAAAEARLVLMG